MNLARHDLQYNHVIISERASAAARSAASASEHSCNVCVYVYRYNVYIQSVYVPEKF